MLVPASRVRSCSQCCIHMRGACAPYGSSAACYIALHHLAAILHAGPASRVCLCLRCCLQAWAWGV